MRKKGFCIDCGKALKSPNSKRCQLCHNRRIAQLNSGNKHWHYIDGKCSKKYYCIDCNKEISLCNGL